MCFDPGILRALLGPALSFLGAILLVGGCGGGSVSTPAPAPTTPTAAPATVQGQWQVVAQSMDGGTGVLIETNFSQNGSNVQAAKSSVVLIQGVPGTYSGLGGECDNGALGNDSIQATVSGQTLSFTLTESGSLGTGTSTGTATISSNGTQITSGTYTTPAACGFQMDSGTLTGALVQPFSGTFAGMLAIGSTSDAVTMTISQSNYNLSVTGAANGTPFTLTGTVVGATFNVSGTIAGQSVQYVGLYETSANDFRVYDTAFNPLGVLKPQSSAPPPMPISVSVSPSSASVQVGQQTNFMATVMNDSANKGVTWALSGSGCSGATCGSIAPSSSASGATVVYTAPNAVPSGTVTLTATSVSDSTKSSSAAITITAGQAITVSLSPTTASLATGGVTQAFTATVQNDAQNKGVTWSVASATCGGAACGAVSPASSSSGAMVTYTSPASAANIGTVLLTATSVTDNTATATATIALTAPPVPTPSSPLDLGEASVDTGFGEPVIATDAAGNVDVAWINTGGPEFVRSTDGGITFSTPLTIPSNMQDTLDGNDIQMGVDGSGNINLLWHRELTETGTVPNSFFSRSTDGGMTFSPETNPGGATSAQLVVAPGGNISIVWFDETTSNLLAVSSSDGVNFSSPTTIWTAVGNPMDLIVEAGPQGQLYLFWTQVVTMTNCSILSSSSMDGTTFTPAANLSAGAGSCNQTPAAFVDSSGNVIVAWDADGASLFFSRSANDGMNFSAPVSIPTNPSPLAPQVTVSPNGTIYIVWETASGPSFASSTNGGATFSPTPPTFVLGDSAVVDSCNNVTVVGGGSESIIQYQRSTDGGVTFSAPTTISNFTFNDELQITIDKSGNVHVIWGVDGPPEIEYVRIPTTCFVQ
jgi:hypothetical protein